MESSELRALGFAQGERFDPSPWRVGRPLVVAVVQEDLLPLVRVRDLANVDTLSGEARPY